MYELLELVDITCSLSCKLLIGHNILLLQGWYLSLGLRLLLHLRITSIEMSTHGGPHVWCHLVRIWCRRAHPWSKQPREWKHGRQQNCQVLIFTKQFKQYDASINQCRSSRSGSKALQSQVTTLWTA